MSHSEQVVTLFNVVKNIQLAQDLDDLLKKKHTVGYTLIPGGEEALDDDLYLQSFQILRDILLDRKYILKLLYNGVIKPEDVVNIIDYRDLDKFLTSPYNIIIRSMQNVIKNTITVPVYVMVDQKHKSVGYPDDPNLHIIILEKGPKGPNFYEKLLDSPQVDLPKPCALVITGPNNGILVDDHNVGYSNYFGWPIDPPKENPVTAEVREQGGKLPIGTPLFMKSEMLDILRTQNTDKVPDVIYTPITDVDYKQIVINDNVTVYRAAKGLFQKLVDLYGPGRLSHGIEAVVISNFDHPKAPLDSAHQFAIAYTEVFLGKDIMQYYEKD